MKLKSLYCLAVLVGCVLLSGCAAQTRYEWSHYDTKMYKHYEDPAEKEEFLKGMKEVVDEGEAAGRVAPGVYAEYGYVLYEQGNSSAAVSYFQKEADKWPEAKPFMAKMIAGAQKKNKQQEAMPAAALTAPVQTDAPLPEAKVIESPEVAK